MTDRSRRQDPVLKVVVDARPLDRGGAGGTVSLALGLAHGLSQLTDGSEEFLFLAYEGHDAWIREAVAGPCRVITIGSPTNWESRAAAWLKRLGLTGLITLARAARWSWRRFRGTPPFSLPASDGTVEALGAHVVHFPFQSGFLTEVPSIYHPHDLQHLHLPEFFTPEQQQKREALYRGLCEDSVMVAVASEWIRDDVISAYELPPEKVVVVPMAPPIDAYPQPLPAMVAQTLAKHELPPEFILYPAVTWPHKNHLRLLEAMAELRSGGLTVPLVCTGAQQDHFSVIQKRMDELRLTDQVHFLGFLPGDELVSLYAAATAVVVPTKFEAVSFPVWEAFRTGVPVACSTVTSLPEQVGNAALLFDPDDVHAMADAVRQLWTREELRERLVERGHARIEQHDWVTTARIFRAHYRRIADRQLSDEDLTLIPNAADF